MATFSSIFGLSGRTKTKKDRYVFLDFDGVLITDNSEEYTDEEWAHLYDEVFSGKPPQERFRKFDPEAIKNLNKLCAINPKAHVVFITRWASYPPFNQNIEILQRLLYANGFRGEFASDPVIDNVDDSNLVYERPASIERYITKYGISAKHCTVIDDNQMHFENTEMAKRFVPVPASTGLGDRESFLRILGQILPYQTRDELEEHFTHG